MSIKSYKGFNADMTCRGFQFKLGEEYKHDGKAVACESGFHACEYPLDVFDYYPPASSLYAEVEQDGEIAKHSGDSKIASSILRVKAALTIAGLVKAAVEYTFARSKPEGASATGYRGAASATGYRGAASATGDQGAASATGIQGAASATGDQGAASATGIQGAASATGIQGAASATGYEGRVKGIKGNALFLAQRDVNGKILHVWAGIVGRDGIKEDTWYTLKVGKPVEVSS